MQPALPPQRIPRRVITAMTSPLGVVTAAAAGGTALLVGLPLPAAAAAAVVGWSARVAVGATRHRRQPRPPAIDPFTVGEPWRGHVVSARRSQRRFAEVVAGVRPGPLRERLQSTATRVDAAVDEVWQIARSGHALTTARRQIDDRSARRQLDAQTSQPQADLQAREALQAQLDAARRLDDAIGTTTTRLAVLDAQLVAATTRAVELAAHHAADTSTDVLDQDFRALSDDMEALRRALEETRPPPPPELP